MTNERLLALFDYYGVDCRDDLIERLDEQLTHRSEGEWKPMETAPKDGTRILAHCGEHVEIWYFEYRRLSGPRWLTEEQDRYGGFKRPDAWMPLPTASVSEPAWGSREYVSDLLGEEEKCKCTLRTKLVGDGCHVCNPEYAKDHEDNSPVPDWSEHGFVEEKSK